MWVPVLIKSENIKPVIFGGGPVACRKAAALCRYGVQSLLVCPQPPQELSGLSPVPRWIDGVYGPDFLQGATMVIAATGDPELNRSICAEAEAQGIFALNASSGDDGSLSFPHSGSTEDITVTVSTGGASPTAGAEILKELLETLENHHWPERVRLLGELRQILKQTESEGAIRHAQMREFGMMSLEELQKRRQEYED